MDFFLLFSRKTFSIRESYYKHVIKNFHLIESDDKIKIKAIKKLDEMNENIYCRLTTN